MNSNFDFLKAEWSFLYNWAKEAEQHAITAPVTSAFYARLCLEETVKWLYENESSLSEPYNTNLSARMGEQSFRELIPPGIYENINYIRKEGNNAAHGRKINHRISIASVKFLFRFVSWVVKMYSNIPPEIADFNESVIPKLGSREKSLAELSQIQNQLSEQVKLAADERKKRLETEIELNQLKQQLEAIQQRKVQNQPIILPPEQFSEAQTRELYIDAMLREAGWNPEATNATEFPVEFMPKSVNPSGKGYVDYVLWGDDGLPLALIEAKKASRNIHEGKHQAELYANSLEKMTGQRPLIYYTNGFDTELWDDLNYAPRKVFGFYTQDELQTLINRRTALSDPRKIEINNEITNRPYQKMAIQAVLDKWFKEVNGILRGASRQTLVVMATGTGKTRTAISFVDVLFKAGAIKRVLFLADRNALVTQAKRNFNKLLPHLSSVDLTKDKEDKETRLVFSTYPTIMNAIDGIKSDDQRFYTVGHFDLIIVDEAHRSVYKKYGDIFRYFDALLLGLTATPKEDAHHDTYRLFDEETGIPTFDYELDEAVNQNYLVPYEGIKVQLGFMERGIRYSDLSEQEKEQYEATFRDEQGNIPERIGSQAINEWLFNTDTVDKALSHLMTNGVKVQGGDVLGKTIIFARKHEHAIFIEERFNKMYPELGNKFLRVIDNYEKFAQDLLDDFSIKDKMPQIAVSVDMLDTGIDVPEIVNLVLFKPVYSLSKFWQMIGRGTRLCEKLFSPKKNKAYFKVFDLCRNFEFFGQNPGGRESRNNDSLSAKIFKTNILLSEALKGEEFQDAYHQQIRNELLEWAFERVKTLNKENFRVRMNLKQVEKLTQPAIWEALTHFDINEIFEHLADLIYIPDNDELAKRFDLLVRNFQMTVLEKSAKQQFYKETIVNTGASLSRLFNIHEVATAKSLILATQTDEFWEQTDFKKLDHIRKSLRDLLKYIPRETLTVYTTNFEDDIESETIKEPISGISKSDAYKQKMEAYIRENQHHFTIQKLRRNLQLTSDELLELERLLFGKSELGTRNDFIAAYGNEPLGRFIRSILGLDETGIQRAFSEFMDAGNLNAQQMLFIQTIINHFKTNGLLELKSLAQPPFTDINDQGIFGLFEDEEQDKIIRIIKTINENVG
ncbi:MAG: DEAD/DEAH box helicase family protein [Salinivirgaceae bacterium]